MLPLTLETRLNLLVGALLFLALTANIALMVLSAGPRIKAENESTVNLARQAVEQALQEVQQTQEPQRELARVVERLSRLRHVTVALEGATGNTGTELNRQDQESTLALWLSHLVRGPTQVQSIPAVFGGVSYGNIVITANPADELEEIAEAIIGNLAGGSMVAVAIFGLTTFAVRRALRPIGALSRALVGLERGNFAVRVPAGGPSEFQEITARFNDLAVSLERAHEQNRRLSHELVKLEAQERRELAAELHDEFGPYLFAIRAHATSLLADVHTASVEAVERRIRACRAMLDQVEAVQQANRRVLQRLRPIALAEMGLERALEGLVDGWRGSNPDVTIETMIELPELPLDDSSNLTVYRVVQEGLTNAFRHAGATRIEIEVGPVERELLPVTIADNGSGRPGELQPGFGLSAMRDRVSALGGQLAVVPNLPLGLRLQVTLPIGTEPAGTVSGSPAPLNRG